MTQPRESDALRPALREVEAELETKMEEVCNSEQAAPETTGELIRLEEALSDAAKAAKQAVSLRRRLRENSKEDEVDVTAPPAADRPKGAAAEGRASEAARPEWQGEGSAVREFTDRSGRAWRVWAVRPETMQRFTGVESLMGEYRLGWLAFESVDGEVRKRTTSYPDDWQTLPPAELEQLLARAELSTRRKTDAPKRSDDPRP